MIIYESGMNFGKYEEADVFQIEKSSQYMEKLMPNGVKSCEFIRRKANKIYFIEAKTSCPNQITAETQEEKKEKYRKYVDDITQKMRNSLDLYANILLNRYPNDGVGAHLMEKDLSSSEIKLVLVVKNAEKAWLEPFEDVFNKLLRDELKIWKIPRVFVINEQMAKEKGLVCE
ncbi:MAG: hypothetical protein LUE29_05065 [Lachnospiraceae bacterium]|nr:hypothetical protein [Lachnospiraceae bacterium]